MCAWVHAVASVESDFMTPLYRNPPGSSVHRLLQARTLEWVAMPFSRGSSQPRDRIVSAVSVGLQVDSLPIAAAKSLQSCPTLCNLIDSSLPGSPIPGIV